jgi:glycosyltransferase involved in cell wall biosynthesis
VSTEGPGLDADRDRRPWRIAQVNDIAAVGSTLARAMTELGESAVVIEPRRLGAGLRYPWKAVSLPFRAAGIVGAGLSLRGGRFDVIHVHYARLGMIGTLAGRPFTLHVHGTDIRGVRPGSLWGRETAPFLRRARLVYFATPDLEEWVRPFRDDAVFLPNPIEVDRFRPMIADDRARPGRRDLLVGVRLAPIKGLAAIVEVLRLLAVARPATTITIVAQGEGVAAATAAAGPNSTVVPRMARAELPELLRGHRLALGQFLVGAIGNYELEALSAGVPVVMRFDRDAAYATPPPLVNVADPQAAVDRICELLDDEAALDDLAARGPAWVDANHAAHTVATRVLDDYRRTGQTPS